MKRVLEELRAVAWRVDRRRDTDHDRAYLAKKVPSLCDLADRLKRVDLHRPSGCDVAELKRLLGNLEDEPPTPERDHVSVTRCPTCPAGDAWEYRGPHWSEDVKEAYREHYNRAHRR